MKTTVKLTLVILVLGMTVLSSFTREEKENHR